MIPQALGKKGKGMKKSRKERLQASLLVELQGGGRRGLHISNLRGWQRGKKDRSTDRKMKRTGTESLTIVREREIGRI